MFSAWSGFPALPNGLLFGRGAAVRQLGIEVFGILVVVAIVFTISYATILIRRFIDGMSTSYARRRIATVTELSTIETASGA